MTRIEPKLPAKTMPDIDLMINDGFKKIANEIGDESFTPKLHRNRSQFAVIGHQAIDAMVKAAEDVVERAQQELESVKTRAEEMRKDFDARDAEIQTMMERVTGFGNDQLNAHRKFANGVPNASDHD